ncbi:hypothetical protein TcWFU_000251 [Taenia crassiceps]|uniref:PH domain-containing protein n=1 Tax=Taenia crassiceps TaxID=6207 RepID=A0ABR4QN72_9CEST
MFELPQFPCFVESWLLVWEVPKEKLGFRCTDNSGTQLPKPEWKPYYCVCREDEAKLYLYVKEEDANIETTPKHLQVCRLNCVRPFPSVCDAHEENAFSGPSSAGNPVYTVYTKKNQHVPSRQFRRKNHRHSKHDQTVSSFSKSAACLVEKTRADSIYAENVYSSHPGKLDSVSHPKTKFRRHRHGKMQATHAKLNFSFMRLFRRSSKTLDCPPEDDREVFDGWHSPQEPPILEQVYLSSSINLKESDSWTSLLDERTRQAPTQHTCRIVDSKRIQTGIANTLRPDSEQIFNEAHRPGALPMADSVCLQKSYVNSSTDEVGNVAPSELVMLQRRRLALRKRLLSRSRQPLDESTSSQSQNYEIDIKNGDLEFGRFQASLLGGQEHCFYIKTITGETHIFAAASQDERDCWLASLRRTAKPNLENERHRENSLFLSILEAKGLHNKRRYYCDICLDRTLYARTTSKQCLGNSIFWAEEFDLNGWSYSMLQA